MKRVLTEPIEIFAAGGSYVVKGVLYPDGRVKLLKGSLLSPYATNSTRENVLERREMIFKRQSRNNCLTEDVIFENPSFAASVIAGNMRNGNEFFRTVDGILLGEFLDMGDTFDGRGRLISKLDDKNLPMKDDYSGKMEKHRFRLIDVKNVEEIQPIVTRNRSGLIDESFETEVEKKATGKTGEQIVKEYLFSHKDALGIKGEIHCYCETDDYQHHDFSYIDRNGDEIYIEVKSTKADQAGRIDFEMSEAEYRFMQKHIDHFFIFYVNDVYGGDAILRIPASLVAARPSKYKVSLKVTEE